MFSNYVKIALLVGLSSWTMAQSASLTPVVDQRVELLSILARLADYPEYSQTQYKSYVDAIETHFTPYKNHPAVAYMRHLGESSQIGFDAVMGYAVQLGPPPGLQPLVPFSQQLPDSRWTANKADSLAVLVQRFYKDAHAAGFFWQQISRYKAAEARFASVIKQIDLPWFQRYYGQPPTQQFHLIIGLANGVGNYGPHLHRPGKPDDIYAVMGTWSTDSTGMASYPVDAYLSTVIHEFNHSFVNPLIDQNWAALQQPANLIYAKVQEPMQRQAYASGKTILCEALVRASVIVYLQQHNEPGLAGPRQAAHHQLREEQYLRFVWMDTLTNLLNRYEANRKRYPTLQSFMPEHNAFYQRLATHIDTVLRAYDARCPAVVSLSPFANRAADVDPATQELLIRFDQPMNPEKYGVALGEEGREHMPVRGITGVTDNNQVFKLKMTLKPNWTYSFKLRSGGFQTPDGYLSNEYTVSFKTKP